MADVLLVHVREDETLADSIAVSLERSGLTVARGESVFDVGGEVPCVVVLWSDVSTRSSMVRDVAIRAQREGKLVAATLGGCETPLGFARPAPHDLSDWGGDPDDPSLDAVFFAADRLVCAAKLGAPTPSPKGWASQPYGQRPAERAAPRELPATPLRLQPTQQRAPAPLPEPEPELEPQHEEPVAAAPSAMRLPPNLAMEALAWKQVENSKNPQDFLDYLSHFGPKGMFSELASMKLDKLTRAPRPAAPKSAFIAHKPSPHVEKKSEKKPPAKAPPPAEPQRPPQPRAVERIEAAPAPPRVQPPEPAEPPRYKPQLSEIRRADPESLPGRTRVATAARRRAAPPPPQTRRRAQETERGGFPWRPILLLVLLGAGGFGVYQYLPKIAGARATISPPGFAAALRAAPVSDSAAAVESEETTELSAPAAPAVDYTQTQPATPVAKPAPAPKKPSVKPVEARSHHPEGLGGPVLAMAKPIASTDKAAPTPPPVVAFHPVETKPPPAVLAPATPSAAAAAPSIDPAPLAETRYIQPRWVLQPNPARLEAIYPRHAMDGGIGGRATLDCAILQSGRLNCVVQSETPSGQGFGAAAVTASREYLASPQAADGTMAYGAHTRLIIVFQ